MLHQCFCRPRKSLSAFPLAFRCLSFEIELRRAGTSIERELIEASSPRGIEPPRPRIEGEEPPISQVEVVPNLTPTMRIREEFSAERRQKEQEWSRRYLGELTAVGWTDRPHTHRTFHKSTGKRNQSKVDEPVRLPPLPPDRSLGLVTVVTRTLHTKSMYSRGRRYLWGKGNSHRHIGSAWAGNLVSHTTERNQSK